MKLKPLFFTAAIALALTFSVDAAYYTAGFTLQNNSQCTGGTLIEEYSDVQDTGQSLNAKGLATADCQMLFTGPDQCCSVQYRRSTPKAPAIGSHVFQYQVYQGGTVAPSTPPAGTLTSSFQHWAGVSGPAAPVVPTASLVANPNSIVDGEQSLLTWSSTNATSCTGTNFSTNNATSGSVLVSPTQTTTYSVQCINGTQSASAQTTISVSSAGGGGASFSVSCRAHPTQARIGEDVLWSSTVTGGEGTYTYSWSGSEGLSGSGNQVFKQYASVGQKNASLTVTYTPNAPQSSSTPPPQPPSTSPPASVPVETIPRPQACPAIGFVMPVSPCSGSWAPTYSSDGCQSGWQCIASLGGAGGYVPEPADTSLTDYLSDFFQFQDSFDTRVPEIQTVDGSILGATAMTVAHTEGELFTSAPQVKQDMLQNGGVSFTETTFVGRTFSADQTTMDRVCTVLHGAGSTATNIGARGYSSCGNNQNFQFSGGRWSVVSGCSYAHISGSFSCLVPAPAPVAGACTLSISPSTVQAGQSAILSWVSNGLSSLTISNGVGAATPVSSGSRVVTPTGTVTFTGSGVSSDSSTNYSIQSAHSSIISVMSQDTAKYGIAYNTSYGIYADPTTITHICELVFGPGAVQQQYDVTAFNSCGNNQILKWDGTRWSAFGACQDNRKMLYVLDCKVPQVSTAPPVQCGGNATLTVTQPAPQPQTQTITVQCENAVQIGAPQCSDGIDNDGDGDIDNGADAGCDSDGDDDEGNEEEEEEEVTQCSDNADNDGDGKIDYPVDPGCLSPQDDDETNTAQQCSEANICRGTDVYRRNASCTETFVESCPHGCSNGACLPAGGGGGGLVLNPSAPIVGSGKTVTISWSAVGFVADSCTLVGTNGDSWVLSGSQGSVVTRPLSSSAEYTLTCTDGSGNRVSKRITIKVSPRFEEI